MNKSVLLLFCVSIVLQNVVGSQHHNMVKDMQQCRLWPDLSSRTSCETICNRFPFLQFDRYRVLRFKEDIARERENILACQKELWELCVTFNSVDTYHYQQGREHQYALLDSLAKKLKLEELNEYNEYGQTLAHRLAPLGDCELYQRLIDHGLDISKRSAEKNDYKGSTAAHSLAAMGKYNRDKKKSSRYFNCLRLLLLVNPNLSTIPADNGKTVKDILGRYAIKFGL